MAQVLAFGRGRAMAGDQGGPGDVRADADADWAQWMRQAQAGDRDTYQRLLQALVPYLSAIARRHLGGDGVDDAVQEVLMIVHRVRHTFEPERPFKPWVATIANRHCMDLARRARGRRRHETANADVLDLHADDGPTPEESLQRQQDARAFRRRVDALPARQRTAVDLLKLQELSLREASQASGLSIAALKVGVHRAVKSLRKQIERDPGHD